MLAGRRGCYTGGIKQFDRRAGRGGDVTRAPCAEKIGANEGGLFSEPSFFLWRLASCGDPDLALQRQAA